MYDSRLGFIKKFRCEWCKRMVSFLQRTKDGRKYWVCSRCEKDGFEILPENI